MKPRFQASRRAIDLIKSFEGYRRASAQLSDGRYTIGYGHTRSARADVEINERDAEALLIYDLLDVTSAVNDLVFTPINQNQFDALVSFAFNIGVENFRRSSVLRRVNEGNLLQAAAAIEAWRRSDFEGERIVVDALIRRRAAEKALFLTPPDGFVPAPSPVLPPRLDYDVAATASKDPAHKLETPLTGDKAFAVAQPGETEYAPELDPGSPVTAAADAVVERLRSLPEEPKTEEPSTEDAAPEPEPEPAAESGEPAEVKPDFVLTPPNPDIMDADFHPASGVTVEEERDTQSRELPFEQAAEVTQVKPSAEAFGRRQPTAYFADEDFPSFHEDVEPMRFHLLPIVLLFIAGLMAISFGVVWGLSTTGAGASAGPIFISWVAGIIGLACIIGAFYLFANRLGAEDE